MADPGSGPGGPSPSPGGPGGPGAPMGDDPGALGGLFGGLFGGLSEALSALGETMSGLFGGFEMSMDQSRETIDDLMNMTFPTALMQGLLFGLTGKTFGDIAQGDPNGMGPSGGPGDFGRDKSKQKKPELPPPPLEEKKPPQSPIRPPKRKRIGRGETILTSGLAEPATSKPTLLGQ